MIYHSFPILYLYSHLSLIEVIMIHHRKSGLHLHIHFSSLIFIDDLFDIYHHSYWTITINESHHSFTHIWSFLVYKPSRYSMYLRFNLNFAPLHVAICILVHSSSL